MPSPRRGVGMFLPSNMLTPLSLREHATRRDSSGAGAMHYKPRWIRKGMDSMFGRQGLVAALACALSLLSAVATISLAAPPGAVEKFRAAAALQQRGLFDLAAADYAALEPELAGDPLGARAGLARGVCLFQLGKFAETRAALAPIVDQAASLNDAEREQLFATLGLACYNLGQTTNTDAAHEPLAAAIQSLAMQLDHFPDGSFAPQAAFYRAEALSAVGRWDAAATAYRQLLGKWPQHPQRAEARYGLVVALGEQGLFVGAVAECQQFEREFAGHALIEDIRPRHASALLSSAEAARQAGRLGDARRLAAELIHDFPESAGVPPALLAIADVEFSAGNFAAAESSLDRCLQRSTRPEISQEAQRLRARVRLQRGDQAGALADAKAALDRDPRCPELLQLCGIAELGLGKCDAARDSFSRLLEIDPNYAAADRVLYDLAWACEQSNEPQVAREAYERLLAAHPQSPLAAECHFRLGQGDFAAKKYIAAAAHFRQAEQHTADAALREKALHQLAWCLYEAGGHAPARQAFETQRHDYPSGPFAGDAAAMAGECCYKLRLFAAAIDHFVRALTNEHTSRELQSLALVHASESAAELREWKRSLEFADRALDEFPQDPRCDDARYARGMALLEMGFLDQSQRELALVAGKQSGLLSAKADLALGRIHAAQQQHDAAVRQFFKVAYGRSGQAAPVSFHATQAEAIFAAAQVLETSGRREAARKLYQELLAAYPTSDRADVARKSLDVPLRR